MRNTEPIWPLSKKDDEKIIPGNMMMLASPPTTSVYGFCNANLMIGDDTPKDTTMARRSGDIAAIRRKSHGTRKQHRNAVDIFAQMAPQSHSTGQQKMTNLCQQQAMQGLDQVYKKRRYEAKCTKGLPGSLRPILGDCLDEIMCLPRNIDKLNGINRVHDEDSLHTFSSNQPFCVQTKGGKTNSDVIKPSEHK